MTIKTPAEIAQDVLALNLSNPMDARKSDAALRTIDFTGATVKNMLVVAIEADRRQRDLYELVTEALEERAEDWGDEMPAKAAEVIRSGEPDDIWERFIGPMLDSLESELGR